jgi:hydroxyethylthiazole kinase-like uncharacterized protein yjeF
MKILDAEQVRQAEEQTIRKQGLEEHELMERASMGLFHYIHERMQGRPIPIYVFCGIGNNGGDGLALARHLFDHGYHLHVFLVNYGAKRSEGFLHQLEQLKTRKLYPEYVNGPEDMPEFEPNALIVDSLFGIGLNRDPDDLVQAVIRGINEAPCFVLAVDMPSGMFLDRVPDRPEWVIQADMVLTFQTPKLVFFLPDTYDYIGNWQILDIGLDMEYINSLQADFELLGPKDMLPWYRERHAFSHKGTFGHVLISGGKRGSMGAVMLAARACLRAGAGKVTALIPECGLIPLQSSLPEVMVSVAKAPPQEGEKKAGESKSMLESLELPFKPDAVVIGMGMGTHEKTLLAFREFLRTCKGNLVLDADALNLLGKNHRMLRLLPPATILLPHPGELQGLIGKWKDDFDKLSKARKFVARYRCILVIKGAHTLIVHEGGTYVNHTGNPGMATAGSGDALAGIVGALLAQKYAPLQSAALGVMLHGLAGDIGASQLGYEAVTASDIIENLGSAFIHYTQPQEETNGGTSDGSAE